MLLGLQVLFEGQLRGGGSGCGGLQGILGGGGAGQGVGAGFGGEDWGGLSGCSCILFLRYVPSDCGIYRLYMISPASLK